MASALDTRDIVKLYPGKEWKRHYNIGYWAMELDVFPRDWLRQVKNFDEIWTVSDFVSLAIKSSPGFENKPVFTMPTGLDPDPSTYPESRERFNFPRGALVFLVVFDLSNSFYYTTSPLAVLAAFHAFQSKEPSANVLLVMKCLLPTSGRLRFREDFKHLEQEVKKVKNVRLVTESLSREDLCALLASVDVFVSLHTSAASGWLLLQVLTLGKLVIAPSTGNPADLMSKVLDEFQFLQLPFDVSRGNVSEPSIRDIEQISNIMSKINADRSLLERGEKELGPWFRDLFDPKTAGERLNTRLKALKRP